MPTAEQKKEIANAEIAVKNNPTDSVLYVELGMAYFHAEQLDEAMTAFKQAVALDPNAAGAYNWMGRVYERLGSSQAAIKAYERAITLDPQGIAMAPHGIAPYIGLGIIYLDQLYDYQAAIEAFQTGLEHFPNDPFAIALLGVTYARVGRFDEATGALEQAISLQPANTFAYGNLSIVFLHLKRYDKVIAACQREIEIEDGHDARRLLGFALLRLDRHDEAIHEFERSIALKPDDYEARGALARVYRMVGRRQEGDEQYTIASEMAGKDNQYGQACFEAVSRNPERALTLLQVALNKDQVQPGWARIDPEFSFLNDDARFQELIGD